MRTEHVFSSSRPIPSRPPARSWANRKPTLAVETTGGRSDHAGRPDRNLYTIVLIDVAMSARHDSLGQRRMRHDLYDLVRSVVEYGGLALDSLPLNDFGDGLRLVIPLDRIQPTQVVDMFVLGLLAGLREHRRSASDDSRIRMRVAFDLGLVEPHLHGWAGDALVRVARLVEAQPVREALRLDPGLDLATVVSDVLYESAVRHGYGYIGPACFRAIRVRIKEFDARAWLLTPRAAGLCGACHGAAA
jgi:hypothetical protein